MKFKLGTLFFICVAMCLLILYKNQKFEADIMQEKMLIRKLENEEIPNKITEKLTDQDKAEVDETIPDESRKEDAIWTMNILDDPTGVLEIEQEEEEVLLKLMLEIIDRGSMATFSLLTFEDVLEFVSIPQLRPVSTEDDLGVEFYSAHDSISGGRLFIFYVKGIESDYVAISWLFLKKDLHFQDFEELREGISTLEDVEEIDIMTKFNFYDSESEDRWRTIFFDFPNGQDETIWSERKYYTGHVTREGVVNIKYEKKEDDFIISQIYKDENPYVDAINENDWP